MKIEYRDTKENGIIQITTVDERWYWNREKNDFAPSSTWISGYYPKGIQFYKWLAQKGWDEAQAIKVAGGNRGSKVHQAIEDLEKNGKIEINFHYLNSETGEQEELTVEEIDCILSFVDWYKATKPTLIESEQVLWYDKDGIKFAGTLDRIYKIENELWVFDFKTSQDIWTEQEIQISSYAHAKGIPKRAILQLGYKRNKRGWKQTEIPDKWELFKHAYAIWQHENPNEKVFQKDYPQIITLGEK